MFNVTLWTGGTAAACGLHDLWCAERLDKKDEDRPIGRLVRHMGCSKLVLGGVVMALSWSRATPMPAWARVFTVGGASTWLGLVQVGVSFWAEGRQDHYESQLQALQQERMKKQAEDTRASVGPGQPGEAEETAAAKHQFYKRFSNKIVDCASKKLLTGFALIGLGACLRYPQ